MCDHWILLHYLQGTSLENQIQRSMSEIYFTQLPLYAYSLLHMMHWILSDDRSYEGTMYLKTILLSQVLWVSLKCLAKGKPTMGLGLGLLCLKHVSQVSITSLIIAILYRQHWHPSVMIQVSVHLDDWQLTM